MSRIDREYEREHLRHLRSYQQQISQHYAEFIERVFRASIGMQAPGSTFRITDYPSMSNVLNLELERFRASIETTLINGIRAEWQLSEAKNNALIEARYGTPLNPRVAANIEAASQRAFTEFVNRKINRLTLSDRVWNLSNQLQSEIEKTLFTGLQEGKSADRMAQDMKQYLKEPDKLFRRVRDANGKLQLSQAAKAYHPGQGVYRSSYKNAIRMTAAETNRAYRSADVARWNNTKFVLGYEVRLSNNHPKFDICDHLAGTYPTTFIFNGWHPFCRCMSLPILPSAEVYREYEKAILNGTDDQFKFQNVVKQVPEGFNKYLTDNKEMLERIKTPLWMKENARFVKVAV